MSQALPDFAPIIPLDVDAAFMDAMSPRDIDIFERAEPFMRQFNDAPDVNFACRMLIAALAPSNTLANDAMAAQVDAEWFCYNCGAHAGEKLFCNEYCRQYGKVIRYIRKAFRDGRSAESDQLEAIGVKIIMLLGGGYPEQERRVSKDIRQQIFERDGVCVNCGSKENLTIDHIHGSNAPDDLRVLCMPCNRAAMLGNLQVTTDPDVIERMNRELGIIAARIASPNPLRPCDADDWNDTWRTFRKYRTEAWKARS